MAESTYDNAIISLRAFSGHVRDLVRREHKDLDAIPGFREAQNEAMRTMRGTDAWPVPAAFADAFADVYARLESEYGGLEEEHTSVAGLFEHLDEGEIRRMIAEFSPLPSTSEIGIHSILRMIAACHNPSAIEPLVERLRDNVICPEVPASTNKGSKLSNWIFDRLPYTRRLRRFSREMQYRLDRSLTIHALGSSGGPRAVEGIEPFLHDSDEGVRSAARKVLDRIEARRNADDLPPADSDVEK